MKNSANIALIIFNTFTKGGNFWGDLNMSLWSGLFKEKGINHDLLVVLLEPGEKSKNLKVLKSFLGWCRKKKYQSIFFPSEWSPGLVKEVQKNLGCPVYFLKTEIEKDKETGKSKLESLVGEEIKGISRFFSLNFRPNFKYTEFFSTFPSPQQEIAAVFPNQGCSFSQKIKDNNPFYKNLNNPELKTWRGCAYCSSALYRSKISLDKKTRILKKQILYLQKNLPSLKMISLPWPEIFFDSLGKLLSDFQIKPMAFHIQLRPDVVVKSKMQLMKLLELMKRRKFSFYISGIGFENFSKKELLILNRGYSPETNIEALNVLNYLSKKYPREFVIKKAVASFILFEPFTSLSDLEININSILKLKEKFQIFQDINLNWLKLDKDVPLYTLAQERGLILEEDKKKASDFYHSLIDIPRGGYYQRCSPYHFKCPEVEFICQTFIPLSYKIKTNDTTFQMKILKNLINKVKNKKLTHKSK